jgi:hypothetical protein
MKPEYKNELEKAMKEGEDALSDVFPLAFSN